jgi:hypothetical protein
MLPQGLRAALSRLRAARSGQLRIELASVSNGRLLPRTGKRRIGVEAA